MAQEPLLNLDTLMSRTDVVRVDGVDHPLRNPAELSVFDYHDLHKKWQRATKVMAAIQTEEGPSDEDVVLAQGDIDATCRLILLAPDEVHKKLTDEMRILVVRAFFALRREQPQLAAAASPAPPVRPEALQDEAAPTATPEQPKEETQAPTEMTST